MWKLLEQAAKTATANASEYVSSVQEKAQSLAATVQEEAATLLHAIGSARTGPVDELLYEEVEDYKAFCDAFKIETHTDEISKILEEDDEIRGLHEQMVPVQLSYEEFWSRYFFRREQEELREQREAERKRKQEEAKAASKAVLEEFEVDDDDEEEFDAAAAQRARGDEDVRDDLDYASLRESVKDEADKEEDAATLAQLREIRASRKAAAQWKQKAIEYQKQLGVLAAKHEDEKQKLQESMDSQYQSLCETYESKMTEMTMQIDEARAIGYNEGIQESEAIVATMREEADSQLNLLKLEIAQLQQQVSIGQIVESNSAELGRLTDALALREQVVTALEGQKSQLEEALREKEEALQKALSDLDQAREITASSSVGGFEEAKKETELWKVRAVKMKKLKEQIEGEYQQFKESRSQCSTSTEVSETAALHAKVAELTHQIEILSAQAAEAYAKGALQAQSQLDELSAQLTAAQSKLETVGKAEYDRGFATARNEMEPQIEHLRDEVARVAREGEAKTNATSQAQIDLLRAELATLRAERLSAQVSLPPADVFAQADAILSSLESPTATSLDASELLDGTWAVEEDTKGRAVATQPDWGEW